MGAVLRRATRALLRRTAAAAVAMAAAAAVLAGAREAAAYGDPDLDWWTIETAHFRVHYDRPLEPIATRSCDGPSQVRERRTRASPS